MARLRQKLGALIYDGPRFALAIAGRWTAMRNRAERIAIDRETGGVACEWPFTSDLHIASVHPATARWLLRVANRQWPIELRGQPQSDDTPRVSFIIGHRGNERAPLLARTLESIAAQRGVGVECIVVEQDSESRLQLPAWVRHIHTPVARETPYNRSAAFNAGAGAARAPLLVFHDNDLLVPAGYAAELARQHGRGWEFIDLKRFIFYLSASETVRLLPAMRLPPDVSPYRVMQNARGGSIAADRAAYLDIGGFDEGFVGWGGEDNEFWSRAETRRAWRYGYLPLLHLWHAPQTEKEATFPGSGLARLRELERVPPEERIARLLQNRSK